MNFIKILLLSLTLLSLPLSANDATGNEPKTEIQLKDENCGLSSTGMIKPYDFTICKNDIVFNMFYNMFTTLYENYLFKVFEFEHLNSISVIDYDNLSQQEITNKQAELVVKLNQARIFETVIIIIWNMGLVIVGLFMVKKIIVTVLTSQNTGEGFGKEANIQNTAIYWGLGAFLLIPVSDVFIINIVALFIITIAIAPAVFIWSSFLYYVAIGFVPNEINNVESLIPAKTSHSYYFANSQYENLVNAHLCKIRTTNLLLSNNIELNFEDTTNYLKCQLPENTPVFEFVFDNKEKTLSTDLEVEERNRNINGFMNYSVSTNTVDKKGFFNTLSLQSNTQSCEIDKSTFVMEKFDCLNIKTPYPLNDSNLLIQHLIKEEFYQAIMDATVIVDNTIPDADQILTIFRKLISQLYIKALDKEKELINRSFDVVSSLEDEQLLTILRDINAGIGSKEIQEISVLFHQALLNHTQVGTVIFEKQLTVDRGFERVIKYENLNTINEKMSMAKLAAKLIMDRKCQLEQHKVEETKHYINQSKNDKKSLDCFNPENQMPYGNLDIKGLSAEEQIEIIMTAVKNTEQELIDNKNRFLVLASYKRRAIDNSFHKSLIHLNAETVKSKHLLSLKTARQEGFVAFSKIIMNINKYQFDTDNFIRTLANSIEYTYLFNGYNKVDTIIDDKYKASTFYNDFPNFDMATNNHLTEYQKEFRHNKFVLFLSNTLNVGENEEQETNLMTMMNRFNPMTPLLKAIGATEVDLRDKSKDIAYDCAKDITLCPVPLKNPLLGMNEAGKTYMNTGAGLIAGVAGIQGLNLVIQKTAEKNIKNSNKGASTDKDTEITKKKENNKTKAKKHKSKGKGKFTGKGLDLVSGFINMISNLAIYFAAYMIVIGAILTFAIPLTLFIYMVFDLISFLIMSIQFLFFGNLTVLGLALYEENRNDIKKYLFNIILSILIKPSLIILSLIFIWFFTYVMFFLLNLTIADVFKGIEQSKISFGFIDLSFIFGLIFVLPFLYIIFTITRNLLKTIPDIKEQLFAMINLSVENNDDGSVYDNIIGGQVIKGMVDKIATTGNSMQEYIKSNSKLDLMRAKSKMEKQVLAGEDFEFNGFKVNAKELSVIDNKGKTYKFENEVDLVKKLFRE